MTKAYKYCTIPRVEHWKTMLTKIKFSRINFLNDPFEGFLRVRDEAGDVIQETPLHTYVASFSRVKPYIPSEKDDSKIHANVYMWSHYADSMNGICLQYGIDNDLLDEDLTYGEVEYVTECPKKITPFFKYKSWAFEKESRFVFEDEEEVKGEVFKEEAGCGLSLEAIYLGVRLLGRNRIGNKRIVEEMKGHPFVIYLKKAFPALDIFVCVRHHSSFRIVKLKETL